MKGITSEISSKPKNARPFDIVSMRYFFPLMMGVFLAGKWFILVGGGGIDENTLDVFKCEMLLFTSGNILTGLLLIRKSRVKSRNTY